MTPKSGQICGCDISTIPKDIHIDLNRFRTRLVTNLQHKSIRRKNNSLFSTTSTEHNKNKVFPDGECLYASIKYAAQCITCITIKSSNMINIKYDCFL